MFAPFLPNSPNIYRFSMKDLLRIHYKHLRTSIDPSLNSTIYDNFVKWYQHFSVVALYYPTKYEADTLRIASFLKKQGAILALPGFNQNGKMVFKLWDGDLKVSKYKGILEPISDEIVEPDLVIMPLLACDLQGTRLGYGKGCYDQALASLNAVKLGLCFDLQIADEPLPREAHDVLLDLIITEKRVVTLSSFVEVRK